MKTLFLKIIFFSSLIFISFQASAHDIKFCGELIPVNDRFVADKLMNILKRQINYVNLPELRKRVKLYFGRVEYYLRETGLPDDFKYLAIVESGFENRISSAGAGGFWQLMPNTARELGLSVDGSTDERNNFDKATLAACKVLASYYLYIKKQFGISSWVLTTAAYNNGIGNIKNAINKQGKNYFQMKLNAETAAYVYKIIAVKELFEYPELYMNNFGYNVFKPSPTPEKNQINNSEEDLTVFNSMTVNVDEADGKHPENLNENVLPTENKIIENSNNAKKEEPTTIKFISAQVTGKYKDFVDGNLVSITLKEDLQVENRFTRKGVVIQGRGWIIDDRIFIDLGYDHDVVLFDLDNKKGIAFNSLKHKDPVILKITESAE
ncbi:MAG: lytic transglycosylase domain-containing protein [Ginsengibacter sp.]